MASWGNSVSAIVVAATKQNYAHIMGNNVGLP